MIPVTCESCDKSLRLKDELAGKKIKCPGCGSFIVVPADDDDADEPAPKKKVAARRRDNDEDGDDARDDKPRVAKPSSVLFFVGLGMALVGLILCAVFIILAKRANDDAFAKEIDLRRYKEDQKQNAATGSDDYKKSLAMNIEKAEREFNAVSSGVSRNTMFAIVFGVIFVAGAGLRGYHHFQMKKWYAAKHSGKKKKKRKDEDDEEEE